MALIATDVNPCYLAYHHAGKRLGLALSKKKFVYLTCLHPSSYLWNSLGGDIKKIEDGYVYFVAFAKLLQREIASQAIEILQQNEVEQLQAITNFARESPKFEDGEIVGVGGDYGFAFHHPRKALDYINKSNYFKTVHEDFGIPHTSEDFVLFLSFKNLCEDNLESPFRVVPKNQIVPYHEGLQRKNQEPTNVLRPTVSPVTSAGTVSSIVTTNAQSKPTSDSTASSSTVQTVIRESHTRKKQQHRMQISEFECDVDMPDVPPAASSSASYTISLENNALSQDKGSIGNKRIHDVIDLEEDQAPKVVSSSAKTKNKKEKKAKKDDEAPSPTPEEYLLAINKARDQYDSKEHDSRVLEKHVAGSTTPFPILLHYLINDFGWSYIYPEMWFLKQHGLSELTPKVYLRPGVDDERNPFIKHRIDFYNSDDEVKKMLKKLFELSTVAHQLKR